MISLMPGQTLEEAARRIAQRIGDQSVRIENRSPLPASALNRIAGILKVDPGAALTVTVSENAAGYVLVAPLGAETAIAPFEYEQTSRRTVDLKITPVIASAEPILDAIVTADRLVVLEPSQVVAYPRVNGSWAPGLAAPLNLAHPMPRDPRGRIEGSPSAFRIRVPGSNCTGSAAAQGITITCAEALDNGWVPGRNIRRDEPAAKEPGWGSDFVDMDLSCGRFTIATRATADGDWADQLTAFAPDGQPASDATPVDGLVTALWPSGNAGELTMTTHTRSGRYELSRVTAACVD